MAKKEVIMMTEEQVLTQIAKLKKELRQEVFILGHHYQADDVIQFADMRGDSLVLAQQASKINRPYIIFCGVHFMAEVADLLVSNNQQVILPQTEAGCFMADTASAYQVEKAWQDIAAVTDAKILPITYINCQAQLKAFVGRHEGSICTSANAAKIIKWGLSKSDKLFFFPDQHLGRNTCYQLGIPLQQMITYNPLLPNGGVTAKQIQEAKIILWYGYCDIHQLFTTDQIDKIKKEFPEMTIVVHPECPFEVVQRSHLSGSTSLIIETVKNAPATSQFAIGTEHNLVKRLIREYPDKKIISLAPQEIYCKTMNMIRPSHLLKTLTAIKNKKIIHPIKVDEKTKTWAYRALQRMLEIS